MLFVLLSAFPAGADELTAIDIFDGMIHYENDQLYSSLDIRDYSCNVMEVTRRTSVGTREIVEKTLYFMTPTVQLQLIDDQAVFYFDDDLLIVLLESVELERLGDTEIDDVECYAIRSTPLDPAFARYNRVYYVAKDDFRHVRTVANHATRDFDNLETEINYTYDEVGQFVMLAETIAETYDDNDNLLATVTTTYSEYEFGLGLNMDFFIQYVEDVSVNPPLN